MNGNDLIEHIESCDWCIKLENAVDEIKACFGYETYNKEKNGDKLNKLIDDLESFSCDVEMSCQTDTLASEADVLIDEAKDREVGL